MRAIVDSNVYISYLLNGSGPGTIGNVIALAANGRIRLAIPPEQIQELRHVVTTKPFLRERIGVEKLEAFITLLSAIGENLPLVIGDPPHVLRDRKDDFLIETAKQNKVDIIVSGDLDLLEWQGAPPLLAVIAPAHLEQYLHSREADQP